MNASLLLVVFLQTGVVLVAAVVASMLARRSPALRLAVGRVALLAVLGLVVATPWLGQRQAPVVPVQWTPAPSVYRVATVSPKETSTSSTTPASAPAPSVIGNASVSALPEPAVESSLPSFDLSLLPVLIWAAGAVLFGGYLGVGYLGLARIRRSSVSVSDPACLAALQKAAQDAGIPTPSLVEGDAVTLPFVAGVWRSTIFFPRALRNELDGETLEAVLRHEVAHIANGDLRWNLFHRLGCVFLWPQPLIWLLRRPMAAAGEELCDHHVLASGIADVRYANCLLLLRDKLHARACPSLAIGAVSRKSLLSRRVEAILDARRSRSVRVSRPVATFTRLGALGIAGIAALVFARPIVTQSQDDPYAGWTKEPYAGTVRILDPNGQPATGASAWLVLGGDLPEVNVRPLKTLGPDVALTTSNIPPRTNGTLFVHIKGKGIGFVQLWPVPKPVNELKLDRSVTFHGQLQQTNGSPVAGVKVSLGILVKKPSQPNAFFTGAVLEGGNVGPSATTDAQGRFTIPDLPVNTEAGLAVKDDRFARLRMADRINIPPSGSAMSKTVILRRAAEISGQVLRNGKPVAGVRIGAQGNHMLDFGSADKGGETVTDANGRYTLKQLSAGTYNVALGIPAPLSNEVTARAHEGLKLAAGQRAGSVDFDLVSGAVIEGRVFDPAGKPMAGTYVGVYGPAHPNSSAWVQSALTDADGHYRLRIPQGKQLVYTMDSRFIGSETLTVADGSKTVVNLNLRPSPVPVSDPSNPVKAEDIERDRKIVEAEREPTPATMSFGKGQPFYGPLKLRNGATVRLAYVQDATKGPHFLWKPDGSAADPADVSRSLSLANTGTRDLVRGLYLRVDIDGVSRAETDCIVEVPHPSSWNVWQSYGDVDGNSMDMAAFRAPKSLKVTDMRIGVAAGEPRVFAIGQPGQAPLYAKISKGTKDVPGSALTSDVTISVVIPPAAEGKDIQLAAYDRHGNALEAVSLETQTGAAGRRAYGFQGGSPTDIAKVELRIRDYQWATFRGIHLYPTATD